jgi:DNA-binding CsgD family transcriptional regulator
LLIHQGEISRVLELLSVLVAAPSMAEFRALLLAGLRGLIPCDLAGYNEISLADGSVAITTDPSGHDWSTVPADFARYMQQHPVVAARRRGDVGAASISDFLPRHEFQQLDLYRRMYEPLGFEDQVSFTLDATESEITAIGLNRSSWGFDPGELLLLDLVTPNLAQARRQVAAREHEVDTLAATVDAIEALGTGLITLDEGRPVTWSPIAARLVAEAFGAELSKGMPAEIADWLQHERGQARPRPLRGTGSNGPVRVILVSGEHGEAVLIQESLQPAAGALESLGLTPRVGEVLAILMEGATNDEIADRLTLSPRTVQHHVAQIFDVLGVRTRTAAAARAREALGERR